MALDIIWSFFMLASGSALTILFFVFGGYAILTEKELLLFAESMHKKGEAAGLSTDLYDYDKALRHWQAEAFRYQELYEKELEKHD